MSKEQKKSLFEKAIDALTDRDEKETTATQGKPAAETAKQKAGVRAKVSSQKISARKHSPEKPAVQNAAVGPAASVKPTRAKAAPASIATPTKGIVTVRSLRIRADHNTTSEVVGGLLAGDEVSILSTWSDGKDTWVKLDKGWAAMLYDGETYIKPA